MKCYVYNCYKAAKWRETVRLLLRGKWDTIVFLCYDDHLNPEKDRESNTMHTRIEALEATIND